jgi:hypothetical protein
MSVKLPRRRSHQARKPPVAPGEASPPQDDAGGTELPLPHERDQSTGQTDPQPTEVMRQAKRDIDRGLVDTDMRATPGLDAERREELLKPKGG